MAAKKKIKYCMPHVLVFICLISCIFAVDTEPSVDTKTLKNPRLVLLFASCSYGLKGTFSVEGFSGISQTTFLPVCNEN